MKDWRSQMFRQSRGIFFHMLLARYSDPWPRVHHCARKLLCLYHPSHPSSEQCAYGPSMYALLPKTQHCWQNMNKKRWTMAAKWSADSDTLVMVAVQDKMACCLFCGVFQTLQRIGFAFIYVHSLTKLIVLTNSAKLTCSSFTFIFQRIKVPRIALLYEGKNWM